MFKNKLTAILAIGFLSIFGIYFINSIFKSNKTANEDFVGQQNRYGNQAGSGSRGDCLADDCLAISDLEYPVSELPNEVIESLNKAIDDEYKAFSTYDAVINEFGNIRPFIMIIRAEEQHISSLKAIFDKYGVEIPDNPYLGKVTSPDSVGAACAIGVQAEIDNAALYRDELIPTVQNYEDITLVFTNLMNASQEKHLPAFERCAN